MATTIDSNDPWDRVRSVINFNCGKCETKVAAYRIVKRGDVIFDVNGVVMYSGRQGIAFKCHGGDEFLEISDAMLYVPKRIAGYQPFNKWEIARKKKEERDRLQRELRKKEKFNSGVMQRLERPETPIEFNEDPRWRGIRPTCAVCGRPVDMMSAFRNEMTRQIVFRFQCHGNNEDVPVDTEEMSRSPDFKTALKNFRPFGRQAAMLQQAQNEMIKETLRDQNGNVIGVYASAGSSTAARPSPTLTGFMEKLIDDISSGNLTTRQIAALLDRSPANPAARVTTTPFLPPPKEKESLLITPTKPRIITLED